MPEALSKMRTAQVDEKDEDAVERITEAVKGADAGDEVDYIEKKIEVLDVDEKLISKVPGGAGVSEKDIELSKEDLE